MAWIALSYTLPAGAASRHRVGFWRRLKALGAVSTTGSLYFLPDSEAHREAFDWLAQEIRDAGGEAVVLRVEELGPEAGARLEEESRRARGEEYQKLAEEARAAVAGLEAGEDMEAARESLARLRRRVAEVARIDFWRSPQAGPTAEGLARLEAALASPAGQRRALAHLDIKKFRGRRWVTRPRPFVDRLACVWLIRRFIDPKAEIVYRAKPKSGEVPFDFEGVELGHHGDRCSFETMLAAFALGDDPALRALAEIVHALDLPDSSATRPETAGVEAVLRGWSKLQLSEVELERRGSELFEGLYAAFGTGGGGPSPRPRASLRLAAPPASRTTRRRASD